MPVSGLIVALPGLVEFALVRPVTIESDGTVKPRRPVVHHHVVHDCGACCRERELGGRSDVNEKLEAQRSAAFNGVFVARA